MGWSIMASWQLEYFSPSALEPAIGTPRVGSSPESRESALSTRIERPTGPISRIVGAYHIVLKRTLEHFFPSALLEIVGDRSIIDWDGSSDETYYRFHDDADGLGVEIEWLGTRVAFQSGNPAPL